MRKREIWHWQVIESNEDFQIPLANLNLTIDSSEIPWEVKALLQEADRRIKRLQRDHRLPGFLPSDYAMCYHALRALGDSDQINGDLFCEWGSGLGVVSCLAAMLEFEAGGIEIEAELVEAARQLAEDFGLSVDFVRGSFIPTDGENLLEEDDRFNWLVLDEPDGYEELGLAPDDFGVVFAYPWPDEELLTLRLFDHFSGNGAVLLSYHGGEDLRLLRRPNCT